jgi:hypothetical protein
MQLYTYILVVATVFFLGACSNDSTKVESSDGSSNDSDSSVEQLSSGEVAQGESDDTGTPGGSSDVATSSVGGDSQSVDGSESDNAGVSSDASGVSDNAGTSSSADDSSVDGDGSSVAESSTEGVEPEAFDDGVVQEILDDDKLPFLLDNKSRYSDEEVYIAIVGRAAPDDGLSNFVWYDFKNKTVNPADLSYNTIEGVGSEQYGKYADVFTKLSDVENKTIAMPRIESGKMFIAFKKPLNLSFNVNDIGEPGYAAPDHNNPDDPSHGIRYEVIEFNTTGFVVGNGIWVNTSRVDAYQYPMGVEVFGPIVSTVLQYRRIGEILPHDEILSRWRGAASEAFEDCYSEDGFEEGDGIIHQPSKTPGYKVGGEHADYFDEYVELVWETYRTKELVFDMSFEGDPKIMRGKVVGNDFKMTYEEPVDGQVTLMHGTITGLPSTTDVIEGAGALATGGTEDLNVQKYICAALNRGVIDLSTPDGVEQNFRDESSFFNPDVPYNEYVAFFHNEEISHESDTYAFAYDDIYDLSSTIQASEPEKIRITIGGFSGVKLPDTH